MMDVKLFQEVIDYLVDFYKDKGLIKIVGIESCGFLFGYLLVICLGFFFVLICKVGKLLYYKISYLYDLEYGLVMIELYIDVIINGDKVLIYDDLLVIGGFVGVVVELI